MFYFSKTKKEHLHLITDKTTHNIPVNTNTSTSKTHDLDWLIICLKAHQYTAAQHWLTQLIQPNTKVVVIRNGLRLKEDVLDFTSEENILECIIDCPTELIDNNYYRTIKQPSLTIPKSTIANKFELLFNALEIDITQVQDFKTKSWEKLCESATLGAILCIHNDTCKLFKSLVIQQQFKDLLNETITVAIADGASIENNFADGILYKVLNYPDTKGSSMLTDLRHGKPLELEAKNGIISKLGKQYHVDTPLNDAIIKLLSSKLK